MGTYKRRIVREKVLQALYAYELSNEPITSVVENIFANPKLEEEDFKFARKLIYDVIEHREELEKYIRHKVAHWELERIATIDKILLQMGICEMLYFPDIPPKVTINEAIEVAKVFSTERSGKFINGILDAIMDDLRAAHALPKTGRGLLTESLPHTITPSEKTET